MVLLIFAGYLVNNYRQAHIRKRNLLLEKLVKEKTKDLEESKEQLEKQYHQLVSAQKELVEKRELEKAKKEIELLKEKLAKENVYLREKQGIIHEVSSIIGNSKVIQEVRKKVVEVAKTDSTVLITGSTGVGKNLIAEAIHDLSQRKERALITVNCAAIPDSLVESELFGYEKGAFTGAVERREGKFEVAEGSTILLDEIGDMPLPVQAKLLNVLQSKKFMRVGGNKLINADVRIIAATNHSFAELIEQGKFRQDLFYRINVYTVHIPDLKDRPEDIEPIAKYFIGRYAMMLNKKINAVTKSALNILQDYPYPGNIRELENIIHRAVIICKGNAITDEDILIQSESMKVPDGNGSGELLSLEEMERNYILKVLNRTNWKIRGEGGAAEILQINAGTLRSRMKKLSIPFVREVKN
jgi:transcriptional regulator with GAF, ATPase, and Fis domain